MASIFTYDPDPPRISSPWSNTPVSTPRLQPISDGTANTLGGLSAPSPFVLEGSGITKLEAEPQDGPTEYKLHLLLRPREPLPGALVPVTSASLQELKLKGSIVPVSNGGKLSLRSSTPPVQIRQKRLEHLTTQLLWRLQQSSPFHSQSTLKLVSPKLPESGPALAIPTNTGKLLPGLEESRGALYEIGVADDGAFIGLTKEEMDESLINLRSMAASLGCRVEILRTFIVGKCMSEKLWVVEALVMPNTSSHSLNNAPSSPLKARRIGTDSNHLTPPMQDEDSQTEQLRVSLTGNTTSGKSSLVGTLSTSALDSGRGKTRLSLLKHRHEIESGVTSSVAPELIGYHTTSSRTMKVVNYGFGNISSWNDIHNATEGERLVFLLDSAGHPRYRRTTVRGLISWAPHWTLCCVAADDVEDSADRIGATLTAEDVLGASGNGIDLSKAHLDLCLNLGLNLIVVVTKLDIATNVGLKNTLSKILSAVKTAGRHPVLLKPDAGTRTIDELQTLSEADLVEVKSVFSRYEPTSVVPIVLTSAVKGSGIRKLHALLRCLPILDETEAGKEHDLDAIFHIDEVFMRQHAHKDIELATTDIILSGHLRENDLQVGDEVLVGPCVTEPAETRPVELSRARSYPSRMSVTVLQDLSRSAPRTHTLSTHNKTIQSQRHGSEPQVVDHEELGIDLGTVEQDEWITARVTSVRNLRLPLRRLMAGQVGTIGIDLVEPHKASLVNQKLRKGMVIIKPGPQSIPPRACYGIKITTSSANYHLMEPGALFTVYVASVRAIAKITSVEVPPSPTTSSASVIIAVEESSNGHHSDDTVFAFDDPESNKPEVTYSSSGRREVQYQPPLNPDIQVCLMFVAGREWVQLKSKVLIMPTSSVEGSSGLEGVVGIVDQVF